MLEYMSNATSKRQRNILLCGLILVLTFTVYCGQNNDQAGQQETEKVSKAFDQPLADIKSCTLCGKEINPKSAGRIKLKFGKELNTCCSFCTASIKKRIGQEQFEAVTVSYSTGEKIDFKKAVFVIESDETPCCTPSVLAFVSKEEAEEFVSRKNGRIVTVTEVIAFVKANTGNRR
jgi:hypothetical protein